MRGRAVHQLPPKGRRVVLAVKHGRGAREWRLLAGDEGWRRLEEQQCAEERDADGVEENGDPRDKLHAAVLVCAALDFDVTYKKATPTLVKGVARN